MAEGVDQPVVQQLGKPLSLIPVGLKEAALDSPSFRATTIHYADQVELVERWLGEFVKAATRLVHEISSVEELVNAFLIRTTPPPSLSEAVLDHDYTVQIMKRFAEGAREYWSHTIAGVKKMEMVVLEPMRAFMQGELRNFKDARQYLAQSQKIFDSSLSRYAAQSRAKEPSALREDAFQLYEARKAYLRASMEFCVLAPQLRCALDKLLIRLFSDQWREMKVSSEYATGFLEQLDHEIDRIRNWSTELEASEKVFRRELQSARKNLEEVALGSARPSRELEEYSVSSLANLAVKAVSTSNLQSPLNSSANKTEKQGWLFMKTVTGKPARTTWVRRWFFVRHGIFGWLTQNARTGGVEESEQIGVLLSGVRPAPQEERRFCFEVKTKDNTIVLQAELQTELTEWFQVFERAKAAVLEGNDDRLSPAAQVASRDAAFIINPPSGVAFATKAQDNLGLVPGEDSSGAMFDRAALPGPERDLRANVEVSSRRSTASEKEGESVRDSASRIIQKLDLHRKSAAGSQLASGVLGGPPSAGLGAPGAARASLMSAGYNTNSLQAALGINTSAYSSAAELTPTGQAMAGQSLQRVESSSSTTLAPSTLTVAPAPTNLSKTTVIVSAERGRAMDMNAGVPSGMMANFWGTISAPIVNRLEKASTDPIKGNSDDAALPTQQLSRHLRGLGGSSAIDDVIIPNRESNTGPSISPSRSPVRARRNTLPSGGSTDNFPQPSLRGEEYPPNYPIQLKMQDAQFKILFPAARRQDRVVLVFRATWNPNEQQDFPGRVYVTGSNIHFYSHHLGLVLLSTVSLGSIEEVTTASGKEFDYIYIHLREDSSESGFTRITVKNFLENPRLLQRRLNFLVRTFQTRADLSLEATVKELVAMEKDAPVDSPTSESWEAVSVETRSDDGLWRGKGGDVRKGKDLKTTIRIDRSLDANSNLGANEKEVTRFKLPPEPVLYVPDDGSRKAQEREYAVSAKALFHVMFGDKSTVFQTLYLERRTQRVKQKSWHKPEDGLMIREFEYQADYTTLLGSVREVHVIDSQAIELLNDHLCYVIKDTKTPWHLPFGDHFSLVSKIVITHVSKSNCKLAIYVAVDWSRIPVVYRGMIEKRAIEDLEEDARRLDRVVTDQVNRLGRQSQTKKAVAIFGHVGQQGEIVPYSMGESQAAHRKRATLEKQTFAQMTLEVMTSAASGIVSSLLTWTFEIVQRVWKLFGAHGLLLSMLGLSLLANMFYSTQVASEWWTDRSTASFMSRLGVGWDTVLRKSVSVDMIDDLVATPSDFYNPSDSKCYTTFRSLTSHDGSPGADYMRDQTPSTRRTARQLARARDNLGTYRHGLLVAMRIVNKVEREVVQAAWEDWLREESSQCERVDALIRRNRTDLVPYDVPSEERDLESLRRWHEEYCGSCHAEVTRLAREGG